VIFIVLLILFSFSYLYLFTNMFSFIEPDPRMFCCDNKYNKGLCDSISIHRNKTTEELCLEYKATQEEGNMFYVTSLVIILIFSYLLSCFIVWIYDKFRKR
jgi:hypothetical protein